MFEKNLNLYFPQRFNRFGGTITPMYFMCQVVVVVKNVFESK